MSRTPLKLPKPLDPSAAPKALSSRAWRARARNVQPAATAAAPAPAGADEKQRSREDGPRKRRRDDRPPRSSAGKPDARHESRPPRTAGAAQAARRDDRPPRSPGGKAPSPRDDRRPRTAEGAVAPRVDQRRRRDPVPGAPVTGPRAQPPAPAPERRVPPVAGDPDLPRLSKRMGELGLCSRREADEWIVNGWVTVDGDVVTTLGTRVSPHARIEVDPAARRHQGELVTIILHKPIGYVSGQAEDGHEPASVLITRANHWDADPSKLEFKPSHLRGLAPAGRLDIDSTGLLVFTQDGRVAKHLIGRDSAVEKEYLVRVEGTLDDAGLKRLQHGLELDGVKLKPAKVSWQNEDQLRFVLREGRKRQIRRMCELVGLKVVGLKRVRSGSVPLGSLPPGKWRYLRPNERF